MDFSNIRDRIKYIASHAECLDDRAQGFIGQMLQHLANESAYLTARQQKYVNFCWRIVNKQFPAQELIKMSGLARMKEAREALKRRIEASGKRNAARAESPLAINHGEASLDISTAMDAIVGETITVRTRRARTQHMRTAGWIGTTRSQKPRSGL